MSLYRATSFAKYFYDIQVKPAVAYRMFGKFYEPWYSTLLFIIGYDILVAFYDFFCLVS